MPSACRVNTAMRSSTTRRRMSAAGTMIGTRTGSKSAPAWTCGAGRSARSWKARRPVATSSPFRGATRGNHFHSSGRKALEPSFAEGFFCVFHSLTQKNYRPFCAGDASKATPLALLKFPAPSRFLSRMAYRAYCPTYRLQCPNRYLSGFAFRFWRAFICK